MPKVAKSPVVKSPAVMESVLRTRYLARQAILDRSQRPVGYELLYRGGDDASAIIAAGDNASQETLDSSVIMGLDVICGQRLAYLNCTRELLLGNDLRLLPADRIVLEILEFVEPDAEVLEACRELREAGFCIALDDFVPTPASRKLLPFAQILKVDVRSTTEAQRRQIAEEFCQTFVLLAEKVETEEEFQQARNVGFDLFQGYYFGMPELLSTQSVSGQPPQNQRLAAPIAALEFALEP